VSCSHAPRFSKKIDINEVPDAAVKAVDLFESTAYKATGFGIIDFLSPVLDSAMHSASRYCAYFGNSTGERRI
jgi:hypothetical protein